eukprot:6081737-Amphidinium_carterae.1
MGEKTSQPGLITCTLKLKTSARGFRLCCECVSFLASQGTSGREIRKLCQVRFCRYLLPTPFLRAGPEERAPEQRLWS